MATSVTITSIADAGNGSVTVTTSGTPSGSLSFLVGRRPYSSQATPAAFSGSNPYTVAVGNPGGWYVFPSDNNGIAAEGTPVWLGGPTGTEFEYLTDIANSLQIILKDNCPLINLKMRQIPNYPNIAMKEIVAGYGAMADVYPCIVISDVSVSQSWDFVPYGRMAQFRAQILCLIRYNNLPTLLPLMRKAGDAVMTILSSKAYAAIDLPSGSNVVGCIASAGREMDQYSETEGFESGVEITWTGWGTIQVGD